MGLSQTRTQNIDNTSDIGSIDALNRDQILLNQEDQEANIVVGQPKIKKTLAIKNPTYLEKSTLTLVRDSDKSNIYYIKFTYDSLCDYTLNIIFSAKQESITSTNLYSSTKQENMTFNLEKGFRVTFFNKECFIDTNILSKGKILQDNQYDMVIEMIPNINSQEPIGYYTLCNLIEEKITEDKIIYKIKVISQRMRAHGMLIEVNEIFNSMRESGECVICFEKNSNTILLPCKHSCCSTCAHSLRMRNLGCPICKQHVDDLLIIDITE
jgi:hypothetical protein